MILISALLTGIGTVPGQAEPPQAAGRSRAPVSLTSDPLDPSTGTSRIRSKAPVSQEVSVIPGRNLQRKLRTSLIAAAKPQVIKQPLAGLLPLGSGMETEPVIQVKIPRNPDLNLRVLRPASTQDEV